MGFPVTFTALGYDVPRRRNTSSKTREFQTPFSQSVINCASPLFPWTVTYMYVSMYVFYCTVLYICTLPLLLYFNIETLILLYIYIYIYIHTSIEARLWRAPLLRRAVDSVSAKALLVSAMLNTESWAAEVRSCPWPQCDSASNFVQGIHAYND